MCNVLVFLALLAFSTAQVNLIRSEDPSKRVDGKYIVVFKTDVPQENIVDYFTYTTLNKVQVESFEIGDFKGVFATLSEKELEAHLQFDDVIHYIEEDQVVSIAQTCSRASTQYWNLDRVSERLLDLTDAAEFVYHSSAGFGVTSYIIDTGIRTTHSDFTGRAIWGTNTVDSDNRDCNGHGTHVASTVAGSTYGIARRANVVAVKVLNCQGSGTNAGVISGIQWVANNARKPANANMSLGGSKSTALNSAVASAVATGVPFIVAAGNSNADACNYSPASELSAITVGATALTELNGVQTDARSSFSNYGTCVDIFAPGSTITGAWINSDTSFNTISGTSMASPHVAGVVSLIQGQNSNLTPNQIVSELKNTATTGVIKLQCTTTACNNSPNSLLYRSC